MSSFSFVNTLLAALLPMVAADSATSLIGLRGDGFVMLASDTAFRRGSQVISRDSDRVTVLGPRTLLATTGDQSSGDEFAAYLARNMALDRIVHGRPTTTRSTAHFLRRELSRLLRRAPVHADFLLAGVDDAPGQGSTGSLEKETIVLSSERETSFEAQLHWIDRAGGCAELPYAAQGPAGAMVMATFDQGWREGLDEAEALRLVCRAISQLDVRYSFSPQGWRVQVVDRSGSRTALVLNGDGSAAAGDDQPGKAPSSR